MKEGDRVFLSEFLEEWCGGAGVDTVHLKVRSHNGKRSAQGNSTEYNSRGELARKQG